MVGARSQFVTTSLLSWIEKLNNVGILVVGDVMLDQFVYGEVSRISPEGPVPVLKFVENRVHSWRCRQRCAELALSWSKAISCFACR